MTFFIVSSDFCKGHRHVTMKEVLITDKSLLTTNSSRTESTYTCNVTLNCVHISPASFSKHTGMWSCGSNYFLGCRLWFSLAIATDGIAFAVTHSSADSWEKNKHKGLRAEEFKEEFSSLFSLKVKPCSLSTVCMWSKNTESLRWIRDGKRTNHTIVIWVLV